jgi:hypothetical protein
MEPDDEIQKTGDWDMLSPPTLTIIYRTAGCINGAMDWLIGMSMCDD